MHAMWVGLDPVTLEKEAEQEDHRFFLERGCRSCRSQSETQACSLEGEASPGPASSQQRNERAAQGISAILFLEARLGFMGAALQVFVVLRGGPGTG